VGGEAARIHFFILNEFISILVYSRTGLWIGACRSIQIIIKFQDMSYKAIQTLVLFAISTFVVMAFAASKTGNNEVRVKFDRTFYSMTYDTKKFTYKEGPNAFSIPIKDCSKNLVNKITGRYESLLSEYKNQNPLPVTSSDIKLTDKSGVSLQIARGSSLGLWLQELPKKIMYEKAEAQVACKH
jgi:hypothetical protein